MFSGWLTRELDQDLTPPQDVQESRLPQAAVQMLKSHQKKLCQPAMKPANSLRYVQHDENQKTADEQQQE